MSLVRINTVSESKTGRKYATTLVGKPLFPQKKDMELKSGQFAWVVPTVQTKSMIDGKLTDLAPENRPTVNIITAVFEDKASAIKAITEEQSLDFELQAAVNTIAKDFGLTPEAMKALETAAI